MAPFVRVENLTKIYGRTNEAFAGIKEVSFEVNEGEFLGVIGRSGCGKTTLLRCIAGFESPDGGKILLDGKSVSRPGPDRFMISQGLDQLFPWLSLKGNIVFAMKTVNKRVAIKELQRKAEYYLELVGLSEWGDYYPYQLSGGMKQRAFLARALSVNPRVLLLDEPFGSLDALGRKAMQDLLLQLWGKTGTTIILVTHDIDECIRLSDRILVFTKGTLRHTLLNPLTRPREYDDLAYREFYRKLSRILERDKIMNLTWADAVLR
ncbi:Bicarbonate transport ATP-binding protein CmpD [Fervidicola ferrireducens]|uniref:Bicarbonate transport ATP-binding protein CmpD n=1 Tax=Fervidicola ferrireducens TaxID=520764 RepID=A0A140L7N8_9FIRM|nr:ABC transporter ATP-binding protein [Fervidicola ferrireducens]KXG76563.1 Bicarbonate transport ATP-binding protein CmpD [Fervidicola ferrireducens]